MAKGTSVTAGTKIEDFAADLGKMLGTARAKAEGWLGQRKAIVKNLTDLRDEASKLLAELGHEASTAYARARRGRPAGSKNAKKAAPRKRRKMSAKARAAISAAQKARWAEQKAAAKK